MAQTNELIQTKCGVWKILCVYAIVKNVLNLENDLICPLRKESLRGSFS